MCCGVDKRRVPGNSNSGGCGDGVYGVQFGFNRMSNEACRSTVHSPAHSPQQEDKRNLHTHESRFFRCNYDAALGGVESYFYVCVPRKHHLAEQRAFASAPSCNASFALENRGGGLICFPCWLRRSGLTCRSSSWKYREKNLTKSSRT